MSKKRFLKVFLYLVSVLIAVVVFLIQSLFSWLGLPGDQVHRCRRKEDTMWKRELIKNKLYSAALISLGALSIPIEYDVTAFIFTLIMGLPLFFAKENWIM